MTNRVGIVRDPRYLAHKTGFSHPESARRLQTLYGMLDRRFPDRLIPVPPRLASWAELLLVHTPEHLKHILETAGVAKSALAEDTDCSRSSYLAAWLAAGGCLAGLEELIAGRLDRCFALVRPPGHHALPDAAGGFCLINNLAVAARWATRIVGLERVLLVDWDVHHGNGIQQVFWEDRSVFYYSTHYMGAYPGTGAWDQAGDGPGRGYTMNVELPGDLTDDDLITLYAHTLGPVIESYRPELILVAAGFDATRHDPMGRLRLNETVYPRLTRLIGGMGRAAGDPPWLLSLEGGYDPTGLSQSVGGVVEALLDGGPEPVPEPSPLASRLISRTWSVHGSLGVLI